MGHRRRARECALQILFQIDLVGDTPADALAKFWAGREASDEARRFAEELVRGVSAQREAIDRRIGAAARHWRLERMARVDRNVLRVAVFELVAGEDPPAVVIDEAIEVAKRFGGQDSGGFVNGVLDTIQDRLVAEKRGAGA